MFSAAGYDVQLIPPEPNHSTAEREEDVVISVHHADVEIRVSMQADNLYGSGQLITLWFPPYGKGQIERIQDLAGHIERVLLASGCLGRVYYGCRLLYVSTPDVIERCIADVLERPSLVRSISIGGRPVTADHIGSIGLHKMIANLFTGFYVDAPSNGLYKYVALGRKYIGPLQSKAFNEISERCGQLFTNHGAERIIDRSKFVP